MTRIRTGYAGRTKLIVLDKCNDRCLFHVAETSETDKAVYETHECRVLRKEVEGTFPRNCPLRKGPVTVTCGQVVLFEIRFVESAKALALQRRRARATAGSLHSHDDTNADGGDAFHDDDYGVYGDGGG